MGNFDEKEEYQTLENDSLLFENQNHTRSLSLEHETVDETLHEETKAEASHSPSLEEKALTELVISTIQKCPNYTIRPSRLAAQLGISVDDASAELCGLLSAVGGGPNGAYFTFETQSDDTNPSHPVMVFTFPQNFESKARLYQRKQSIYHQFFRIGLLFVNIAKVMVAFGLFLSLFLISIAMIVVILSMMVAFLTAQQRSSSNSRNNGINHVTMQRLLGNMRQWLWYYYIFGGMLIPGGGYDNHDESIHPFLREVSLILANVLGLLSGRGVFLYPLFRFRQRRGIYGNNRGQGRDNMRQFGRNVGSFMNRQWGSNNNRFGNRFRRDSNTSDFQGISGSWNENNSTPHLPATNNDENPFRGLLSIAVEFLFGPTPFWPEPTDRIKWRLRAEIIISKPKAHISLEELCLYVDDPPKTLEDVTKIISSGLEIVTHFNGVPVISQSNKTVDSSSNTKSMFGFPELLSEASSEIGLPTPISYKSCMEDTSFSNQLWYTVLYSPSFSIRDGILHSNSTNSSPVLTLGMSQQTLYEELEQEEFGNTENITVPTYLYEQKHSLTKLSSKEFYTCVGIGLTNFLGMVWLCQTLSSNPSRKGYLAQLLSSFPISLHICQSLASILYYYSIFFFLLPLIRLGVIIILNHRIQQRNERRKALFHALEIEKEETKVDNTEEAMES